MLVKYLLNSAILAILAMKRVKNHVYPPNCFSRTQPLMPIPKQPGPTLRNINRVCLVPSKNRESAKYIQTRHYGNVVLTRRTSHDYTNTHHTLFWLFDLFRKNMIENIFKVISIMRKLNTDWLIDVREAYFKKKLGDFRGGIMRISKRSLRC